MPLADFVGEGQPIPALQGTSSVQAVVEPAKFAVIIALSRELYDNPNAEGLIRQALVESAGPALDRRLFDNAAAVPDLRPAGLLNGIAPTPASSLTDMHSRDDRRLCRRSQLRSPSAPAIRISST